jgi:hypothetical protein
MQKKIDIPTRGVATIFKKDALEFVRSWDKPIVRLCLNKEQSRWEQVSVRKIHKSWILNIELVAACDPLWPKHMIAQEFTHCYLQLPDLTAALLNFLREKWAALETSKAGKLKRFLSQNTAVKWVEGFASREAVEEANAIRKILKAMEPHKNIPCPRPVTEEDEKFRQLSETMWANREHRSGVVPDEFGNVNAWALSDGQLAATFEHSRGGEVVTIADVCAARRWVVENQKEGEAFAETVLDKDGYLHLEEKPLRRKTGGKSRRK